MAFQKGKSGNINGARKAVIFYDSLMLALKRVPVNDPNAKTALQAIANKVVELAQSGDMQAIKYVMDRMDGSPTATVDMNISDNRDVAEQTDAELAAIIAGAGSDGDARSPDGPPQPDSVH